MSSTFYIPNDICIKNNVLKRKNIRCAMLKKFIFNEKYVFNTLGDRHKYLKTMFGFLNTVARRNFQHPIFEFPDYLNFFSGFLYWP